MLTPTPTPMQDPRRCLCPEPVHAVPGVQPSEWPRAACGTRPCPLPPCGGDTCCHTGWVAWPACSLTPQCTHTDNPNPGNTALLQHSTGWVLSQTPQGEEHWDDTGLSGGTARGMLWLGAGSTYFFIIIIFLLLAARTAPGRCCHQAKAPLSWRLYGLRRTGGTVAGGVARQGHRMETKM